MRAGDARHEFHRQRLDASLGIFVDARALPERIEPSFSTTFSQALQGISQAQAKSSSMQREVQFGNPTVSLEETMIAMQKAQLGFQSAVQFRNKLVQAYTDIMNMQV